MEKTESKMTLVDEQQFDGVIKKAEAERLRLRRARYGLSSSEKLDSQEPGSATWNVIGLALSGGGIRSATFGLGVMQALAKHDTMKRIDYLSTVSGGGYIGSSLTWFLNRYGRRDHGKKGGDGFSLIPGEFPFGARDRKHDDDAISLSLVERDSSTSSSGESPKDIIHWFRQHGRYLTPGDGHNLFAFIAICLRGIVLSVLVYFPLIALIVYALAAMGWLGRCAGVPSGCIESPVLLYVAAAIAMLLVVAMVAYSIATRFARVSRAAGDERSHRGEEGGKSHLYTVRRVAEKLAGAGLLAIVVLVVVGSVPFATEWIESFEETQGGVVGAIISLLGMLSSIGVFRGDRKIARIPTKVVATVGAALLMYGLLLCAYGLAKFLLDPGTSAGPWLLPVMVGLVIVIGFVTNTNYVSIHRYYRDRLMETFMPSLPLQKRRSRGAWHADRQMVHEIDNDGAPYHLVNTNVVLVDSGVPKFRGRGGDAFVISPLFSGSAATGWTKTEEFMGGNMSLPSAMAISGAAAHPNTGVGGEGVTRNYFVSFLMAFMNVRLGFWARNPNPGAGRARWIPDFIANVPDFIYPGLRELLGTAIDERGRHVLLTDGGHFENLGIYELIRRKCKVIIACDGGADPSFDFSDLSNAVERVRADFGVKIELTSDALGPLVPTAQKKDTGYLGEPEVREKFAARGFLVAPIEYPDRKEKGWLVYIKTTFTRTLSADLYGYRCANPSFPDQSTADQFFDETQFEAYRELGYQLASEMRRDPMLREAELESLAGLLGWRDGQT